MFIPHTRGGALKRKLTLMEEKLPFQRKFKYVERSGTSLGDMLTTKEPWAGDCGRERCFACTTGNQGKCMRPGVLYSITCTTCMEEGKKAQYWGETARTGYDRGLEHLGRLKNKSESSGFWIHQSEVHGEEQEPRFSMKIER